MNSKSVALTESVREFCDAPTPACSAGHSSINASRTAHASRSRVAITSSAPRRAGLPMFCQLDAKRIKLSLNLVVITPHTAQDSDQLFRRVHADFAMKRRPPDLEYADKVVID